MIMMKNLVFVSALLIFFASAWSQEETTPPARKSNLLARRPVGGRGLGRGASVTTTTTTTVAPADEEILDNVDENYEDNDAAVADENGSDEPVTTTAAPKNKPLKLGVRPFRSNDDLLQALKRRQQHMRSAKKVASYKPTIAADEQIEEDLQKPAPSPSTSPVHSQRNTRKRYGGTKPSLRKAEPKPIEEAAQAIEDTAEVAASPTLPVTLARRTVRSRYTGKRN